MVSYSMVRKLRGKLERCLKAHVGEFHDIKDGLGWACTELAVSGTMLCLMYPTTQDYWSISEFKHIND